jgi:hypothetical protein
MSLKLNERYPGRFSNPTAAYPQGSFKNRTAPGALDGTYLEKDWANDQLAFLSSLLDAAGIAPNGNVDQVGASQYFAALQSIIAAATAPSPQGIKGAHSNLRVDTTGANAIALITADEFTVRNATNGYTTLKAVSVSANLGAAAGAGAIDAGVSSASTWYYLHIIYNPTTSSRSAIASLSATAPTLPAGYTMSGFAGMVRTDATANKFPLAMIQRNDRASLVTASSGTNLSALPVMASGSNPATLLTVAVGAFAPPNAVSIIVAISSTSINTANSAGPNASYVQGLTGNIYQSIVNAAASGGASQVVEIFLESTNIYANLGGGQVRATGWRLNL